MREVAVAVALNSQVAAGQPLVRFDGAQLQQALAAARQSLAKARLERAGPAFGSSGPGFDS